MDIMTYQIGDALIAQTGNSNRITTPGSKKDSKLRGWSSLAIIRY